MVAVRGPDAERFVADPPSALRLFLVYGPDQGSAAERARRLEKVAEKRARGGVRAVHLAAEEVASDPLRLADEIFGPSLFGGEPLVRLRVFDLRHNILPALQPLLDAPLDGAWAIVEAGDLRKEAGLRRVFEASPHAAAIPSFLPEAADIADLARTMAGEAGKRLSPDSLTLLKERLGGDRLASRGEIDKLLTYVGDAPEITAADIEAIVGETADMQADRAIDAALLGDHKTLETELRRLRAEGYAAAALGAQALRHLVILNAPALAVAAGAPAPAAIERLRPPLFHKRKDAAAAALRRWPPPALRQARRRVAAAILRSRRFPDLADALLSDALHAIAAGAPPSRPGR